MTAGVTGMAADSRTLDGLRQSAARDPNTAVRRVAMQFEALFMEMVLKSMRDAIPQSGMLEGAGHEMYQGMLDAQFAQTLGGRPGGLSELIAQQLSRSMNGSPEAQAAGTESPRPPPDLPVTKAVPTAMRAPQGDSLAPSPPSVGRSEAAYVSMRQSLAPMPIMGLQEGAVRPAASESVQASFVARTWSAAAAAERVTGVPASFVVGQAALETGWGRREIRFSDGRSAHNLFGIKADAKWRGPVVEATTTEYVNGQPVRSVERFRAYASDAESFADWAKLMANSPRYANVLRSGSSPAAFGSGMQRAGYATDPNYAAKLERVITQALSLRRIDT